MPSIATGALFGDHTLKGLGVSGDGDSASIGMGQFKHVMRRNVNMVYIVENNGVYGLTKGQFSATAEKGLSLKKQGENPYMPVDICMEALVSNATFVARSFAGDAKQVKDDDEIIVIADSGKMIRMDLSSLRIIGRSTQGVRMINLEEGEKVVGMDTVAKDTSDNQEEESEEQD